MSPTNNFAEVARKMQAKVRRLEKIAWVIAALAGIFGVGRAWGLKVITATNHEIGRLQDSRDSLQQQLQGLKSQMDSSREGLVNIRLSNEDIFNKFVRKKMEEIEAFDEQSIVDKLPRYTILGWYTATSIPKGLHVCDGNAETPNLNDRFAVGTIPQANNLGALIGKKDHQHQVLGPTKYRAESAEGDGNGPLALSNRRNGYHTHEIDLPTSSGLNIPPATYIIFIMKE